MRSALWTSSIEVELKNTSSLLHIEVVPYPLDNPSFHQKITINMRIIKKQFLCSK
jgi:hypothetical protein